MIRDDGRPKDGEIEIKIRGRGLCQIVGGGPELLVIVCSASRVDLVLFLMIKRGPIAGPSSIARHNHSGDASPRLRMSESQNSFQACQLPLRRP